MCYSKPTSNRIEPDNVDPQEIEKFNAIAQQWWDTKGKFKPLHDMNPLRLQYLEGRIGSMKNLNILDVGCGGGILSESMAKCGAHVIGIDMAETSIQIAQLHAVESKLSIDYKLTSVENLVNKYKDHFDVITCLEMLEHVPDPASIVLACSKLLKKGGHLFFSTINRNLKSYFFAIIGAEYVLRLLPVKTHDYRKFIRPNELIKYCRAANLKHQHSTGILYNPITKKFSLSDNNLDVNYIVHIQK